MELGEGGDLRSGLDTLVEGTRGPQPWRRIFHALNGVLIVLAMEVLPVPTSLALVLLGASVVGLVAVDLIRLRSPRLNELFFTAFRPLVSPREAHAIASSTWYASGMFLTLGLFPRDAAISAILVLSLADPAASWAGRRWGRIPFRGGSLEGTLVFAAVAFAVLAPRHALLVAAAAAIVAALAERFGWPLDDNVSVPLAAGAALTLLSRFT
jgi:dolichol kinase